MRILTLMAILWAGILTAQSLDGDGYVTKLTSIAEQASLPGAYKGKIAIEFANYYNTTIQKYPAEVVKINALTNRVADEYNVKYSMKGGTMESAQFARSDVSAESATSLPEKSSPEIVQENDTDTGEILTSVEQMPRFPGCEEIFGNKEGKFRCSQNEMFAFIHLNLKYPDEAKQAGIAGTVMVDFTVNIDGSIADAEVTSSLGYGCDEEALRVVELMNYKDEKWTPGVQNGDPVRVRLNVPILFKLQ